MPPGQQQQHKQPARPLTLEFAGGLELLFPGQPRRLDLDLGALGGGSGGPAGIPALVAHLAATRLPAAAAPLFLAPECLPAWQPYLDSGARGAVAPPPAGHAALRPGILVLVNDTDWECLGAEAYELQGGDCVLLISTLHGG